MSGATDKPLVIIGAGPGGVAAALRAAQLGAKVTIIEPGQVGGVCTSRGCIPLRVLGSAADLARSMAQAKTLGLAEATPEPDPDRLASRVKETTDYIRLGTEALLGAKGVELIRDRAALAGPDKVRVGDRTIQARAVILAAGAKWARPSFAGADLPGVVTSDQLLARLNNPGRLVVLGDQPWAVEMAGFYSSMGAGVTLAAPQGLLPQADRQIAGRLRKALKAQGIDVLQQARPLAVSQSKTGLKVQLTVKDESQILEADQVLVTDRVPSWEGLGLRSAGVEISQGRVTVDDRLRSSNPNVFALGDLLGEPMLSHKASAQGVIAAENALGRDSVYEPQALSTVLFSQPEAAWVGLSEKQAKAQGLEVVVGEMPYGVNARAAAEMNTAGFVKIVCGARYREVLGVHILGPHASELITQAVLAIQLEATADELSRVPAPHPAYAEALVDAARMVLDGALYVP